MWVETTRAHLPYPIWPVARHIITRSVDKSRYRQSRLITSVLLTLVRHASHQFTFYYEHGLGRMLRPTMVTFEQFVKGVGKEASRYTASELGKLYVDVQQ